MTRFLLRRFSSAVVSFLGITILTFVLIHAVPGDPIVYYLGGLEATSVPSAQIAALRAEHRLDRPLPEQYLYWVGNILRGDFGRSIIDRRPVSDHILTRLPNTFVLNFSALMIALAVAIPLGFAAAMRRETWVDHASRLFVFIFFSIPSFWLALLLMQLFAVQLGVAPLYGMVGDDYDSLTGFGRFLDRLHHLALPALILASAQMAIFARFVRGSLLEESNREFVSTARAKGAGEARVMGVHVFRNALIPLVSLLGLAVPYLLSGSVIIERMFQWDGVGQLYINSILSRDYPIVMGLTVVTAVVTLVAMFSADVLYAVVDPRVRIEGRKR